MSDLVSIAFVCEPHDEAYCEVRHLFCPPLRVSPDEGARILRDAIDYPALPRGVFAEVMWAALDPVRR